MRRGTLRPLVVALALALVATGLTSCAGGAALKTDDGLVHPGDKPVRGGTLTYGLGSDTPDMCPISATFDLAGMERAYAIYDTLTRPAVDKDGKVHFVPYLASAVTHNADYTRWVIDVRKGVKFQDGTDLTGQVVKDNLDAFRQHSLLFQFVFTEVQDTLLTGPMQVTVVMKKAWVAFDAFLFGSNRIDIMAERQLKGIDPKTGKEVIPSPDCSRTPIGTGPFQFEAIPFTGIPAGKLPSKIRNGIDANWTDEERMHLVRNPHYWQIAPDGKPFPYLDSIEFRTYNDSTQMRYALQAGDLDLIHTNSSDDLRAFTAMKANGTANNVQTDLFTEVNMVMFNTSKPPFNNLTFRKAIQYGISRETINTIVNQDLEKVAPSGFAPGVVGYLEDSGWPKQDVPKAKAMLKQYLESPEGKAAYPKGKMEFTLTIIPDAGVRQIGELVQAKAKEFGIKVNLATVDQVNLINRAIGGDYQAMVFRNYPGGDPDQDFVWWHCYQVPKPNDPVNAGYVPDPPLNPTNFSRFCDQVIDKNLDIGRSNPDPAVRKKAYEAITREFAAKAWTFWAWYARWALGFSPKVHDVYGPDLPGGQHPYPGLATGHVLIGIWKSK